MQSKTSQPWLNEELVKDMLRVRCVMQNFFFGLLTFFLASFVLHDILHIDKPVFI